MAGLTGLGGLKGISDPVDTSSVMDEGVLEARANPLDSDHEDYGSQYYGYSGTVPTAEPWNSQGVYEGADPDPGYAAMGAPQPGVALDQTPTSHRAPWPRGIIQDSWDDPGMLAVAGEQTAELHSPDFGAPEFYNGFSPAGRETDTNYTTDRYPAPNESYQSPDIPGQLKGASSNSGSASGHGNADTVQGYGTLNSTPEFQMGHSIRRVQHDPVPFDFTNTHGEQDVPFMGRHPVYQADFTGPDSPYYEQGSIDGGLVPWEGYIGDPSPYVQPAEPTIGEAPQSEDVFAW